MKVSRMVGIPEEKLAAIKGWATSDKFDDSERAVMAAADELVGRNLIEDATFAQLKHHFSDEQIMELVYVIALWRMHGLIVRALHHEYDHDTTARMSEIPAPPSNPNSPFSNLSLPAAHLDLISAGSGPSHDWGGALFLSSTPLTS